MGMLGSVSKSAATFGLHVSEWLLLIFGLVLVVGLIGELAKSDKWIRRKRLFELLVIVGVAGELFGDGGIFLFSEHLQAISGHEVAELNLRASQLYNQAHSRWIPIDPFLAALKNKPKPRAVEILFDKNDPDSRNLAGWLYPLLMWSGWPIKGHTIKPIPPISENPDNPFSPPLLAIGAQLTGVSIVSSPRSRNSVTIGGKAAEALGDALLTPLQSLNFGTDPHLADDELRVVVAPKPNTLPPFNIVPEPIAKPR